MDTLTKNFTVGIMTFFFLALSATVSVRAGVNPVVLISFVTALGFVMSLVLVKKQLK